MTYIGIVVYGNFTFCAIKRTEPLKPKFLFQFPASIRDLTAPIFLEKIKSISVYTERRHQTMCLAELQLCLCDIDIHMYYILHTITLFWKVSVA